MNLDFLRVNFKCFLSELFHETNAVFFNCREDFRHHFFVYATIFRHFLHAILVTIVAATFVLETLLEEADEQLTAVLTKRGREVVLLAELVRHVDVEALFLLLELTLIVARAFG